MEIKNSIALITGANRGIGKAIIKALHNSAATGIYTTARKIDTLVDVVAIGKEKIIPLW
jgi:NADP-dependent 3-hydroxy acid dehydrogenase YdfG